MLTGHFVSLFARVKYLAEVTDGVIDERIATVFYTRRIAAFDTLNDQNALVAVSRIRNDFSMVL